MLNSDPSIQSLGINSYPQKKNLKNGGKYEYSYHRWQWSYRASTY